MVTRKDYTTEAAVAAKSVLIEVAHLLGEYRADIVLIGGWVPELLYGGKGNQHVGSMDVDLALNHRKLQDIGYETILNLLKNRGYQQGRQPFIFYRDVPIGGREIRVELDLLSGEYEGSGRGHRHQKIQDVLARKARGCDLALELFSEVTIEGELPGGGKDSVKIKVASTVSFLVMKGITLDERLKEKDAYDIYYCFRNYPGSLDSLAEEFKPHMTRDLVREGLEKLAKHFGSETHSGPKFIADFEELAIGAEDRELLQRDAYERVKYVLEKLRVEAP